MVNDEVHGFEHEPVMVDTVVDLFASVPPGTVLDATVGGAGHAEALLAAHPHLTVVGMDRDRVAVHAASTRLARFGERAHVVHARFDALREVLARRAVGDTGGGPVLVGALFDLGVSSPQLDRPERGFSYRFDAPLDMRMDTGQGRTAADVLNDTDEAGLVRLLRDYGDEPHARRIARSVVAGRPLHTTGDLVNAITAAVPAPARRRGGHPARRTFQAIRIEVNDELAVLGGALDDAIDVLGGGGRIVVLAYHSGEDRIAKARLRHAATGGCTCPPRLPCGCGATPTVRLLRRGAIKASDAEVAANRRAESVRLRAAQRLEVC